MYAILDIETTGGQFNEEGITEIAIYKFDGHEIVDQFISLVNSEIPIQPFVVKLTGINNAMLQSAPKFYEIAKRIVEITQDCILVAHNTAFDYRILRNEFRRLGYEFESQTLCTVELAQKLIPEQPSYSLGKLVRALGIPMADRHRASGDALATVKLFKLLLDKDFDKVIVKSLVHSGVIKGLEPKLLEIIEKLPSKTGIYYIHRKDGKIIFIGKSRNIKKQVNQHFVGTSGRCLKIQLEVFAVTYEETGTELIAMLKEIEELKRNSPIYNKVSNRNSLKWSLYKELDQNGYLRLKIEKTDHRKLVIMSFVSEEAARASLFKITADFNLCQKLNGLLLSEAECLQHRNQECNGACINLENPETYNKRVSEFLKNFTYEDQSLLLIDKGRKFSERSAVIIENGLYKGYAFFDLNYQVNNLSVLRNILIPMNENREARRLIQQEMRKNKHLKIVSF